MLSAQQLEARRRTLGASEIAAVAGVGRKNGLDVWARKCRGPKLELAPLVIDDEPEPDKPLAVAKKMDTEPRDLGHLFEKAIGDAYAMRTGNRVTPWQETSTHKTKPWATATPDAHVLVPGLPGGVYNGVARGGLEIKLVGHWMRGDWPPDGIPDYVRLQCQWTMGVVGASWWDVAALVDGTDLRIRRVDRDDDLIESMLELGEAFWNEYVLGDKMPPARNGDQALKMLTETWRKDNGKMREFPTKDVEGEALERALEVEAVVRQLVVSQKVEREAKKRGKELKAILCGLCGEYKSVAGPWGRFDWPTQQGNPKWKDVAEELAEGRPLPDELLERHRGDGFRKPALYAHSKWKKRVVLAYEHEEAAKVVAHAAATKEAVDAVPS